MELIDDVEEHAHSFQRYELSDLVYLGWSWRRHLEYVTWHTYYVGYRCTICNEPGYEVPV